MTRAALLRSVVTSRQRLFLSHRAILARNRARRFVWDRVTQASATGRSPFQAALEALCC